MKLKFGRLGARGNVESDGERLVSTFKGRGRPWKNPEGPVAPRRVVETKPRRHVDFHVHAIEDDTVELISQLTEKQDVCVLPHGEAVALALFKQLEAAGMKPLYEDPYILLDVGSAPETFKLVHASGEMRLILEVPGRPSEALLAEYQEHLGACVRRLRAVEEPV
jgi:hypothetical protein